MKKGDYITWQYLHHFNSKSRAWKTKFGVFLREVRHNKAETEQQMAVVLFAGNKSESRVPLKEIKPAPNRLVNLYKAQMDIAKNF